MSLSIPELDETVRAFYEGRGETVGENTLSVRLIHASMLIYLFFSKNKHRLPLIWLVLSYSLVGVNLSHHPTVQRECRCVASGRPDLAGSSVSANKV